MNLFDRIAYDTGGHTVQEILSSFCKKILEIIDLVNKNEEVCDETRTIIENIRNEVVPELVNDIIKDLQDNGYFDNLVNVTLIENLRTELTTLLNNTITDHTTRLDNIDSQLNTNAKEIDNLKYANKKFIAHKGFVALAPENTLKSIEKACENGFDMVEMDVTMTKDYKYVLLHDGTIDRTTNGTGAIYTYTLDELKQFKIDIGVMDSDEIIKIPTFEDAVKICANYGVGINIDASKPDIPYAESNFRYFIQLLKDNNIFEKSCIATESTTKRLEIMKVDPNTTLLWVSTLNKLVEDMEETWNYKNVIIGYNSTVEIPSKEQVKIIHDNGVKILMYGVNNYETYLKLKNLNIDYIETETIYPNGGGN